jgi:polyphosphate kinase 2 (PPK2 family)
MPPEFAHYRVPTGADVSLADHDPAATGSYDDAEEARAELADLTARIADLQARLYAEDQRSLLVVLQGIDAAGKDSSVKHVFRGTNPQGVRVYEDVLVVRVKGLVEEERWRSRYDSINDFERMLAREGTTIVKFFLHISKDAQMDRFRERLEREDKHYKFSANDVRERRNWDAYQEAYEDAVNATSTPWAPWHIVPADHKWYRNLVVARIVCSALEELDPQWPPADVDVSLDELDQESVSSSR